MLPVKKYPVSVVVAILVAFVIVFILLGLAQLSTNNTDQLDSGVTTDTHSDTREQLGVIKRVTEPGTGRTLGYDIRGVVSAEVTENTFSLNVAEEEERSLIVSLGKSTERIGYLDKRTSQSQTDGLIEKNTYTSDTVENVVAMIEPGQTLLVHVPVWIEEPQSGQCDKGCVERIQNIRTQGVEWSNLLEEIINGSLTQVDDVFIISMVEIEK